MIGHFPEPYPDELFYSLCARFGERMHYRYPQSVMLELFGKPVPRVLVEFPRDLGYLVAALPPGHAYTVERFIDRHTLLPFYAPFIPPLRLNQMQEQMRACPGRRAVPRIYHPRVLLAEWLRFCPACVAADRRQWGECYWHRLHQVPGIYVCPVHQLFLEFSRAQVRNQVALNTFISAEKAVGLGSGRPMNLSNPCHQTLIEMARDAAWLLNQGCQPADLEGLRDCYVQGLIQRGLASRTGGNLDLIGLLRAFTEHYPPELLSLLNCAKAESAHWHWLFGLFRQGHEEPPLSHLLLMHFFGYSAESFFALPREPRDRENRRPRVVRDHAPRQEQTIDPQLRAMYRVLWLSVRKKYPQAGIAKLNRLDGGVCCWLRRHDREWLNAHKPPDQQGQGGSIHVDWGARDREIAEQVRQAAQRLRNLPGRPMRVTTNALGRATKQTRVLTKPTLLARLPLTARALAEERDSYESIALRRLQWALAQEPLDPRRVTREQLLRRAGIYRGNLPSTVEDAIQSALKSVKGYPATIEPA